MPWDVVGALAELLGALGVIVSRLYVATQIRRSTRIAKALGFQTLVENLHQGVDFLQGPAPSRRRACAGARGARRRDPRGTM